MTNRRWLIVAGLLAAGAGVAASMIWGAALKPWVAVMMILAGIMWFTPLMYLTEDGGRLPPMPWAKWLGAAFICQGAAQLVPEGPVSLVAMSAATLMLVPAFLGMRKPRAAV